MVTIEGPADVTADGETDSTAPDEREGPQVAALRSTPERIVFTEDGNSAGWISTDLTVDLER